MKLENLELLENRLVIRKIVEPAGGIEIPEGSLPDIHHFKGEIICVGPNCKTVKKGDTVIFRDGYNKLKLDGEDEVYVTREDHIVGVFKDHA